MQQGYFPVIFSPQPSSPPYKGSYAPSPPGQPTYTFLTQSSSPQMGSQASSLLEEKVTAYLGGGSGVLRVAALQYNSFNSLNGRQTYANGDYRLWGTADVGASSPGTPTAFNGTTEHLTFPNILAQEAWWSNNRDLLMSYAVQMGPSVSAG
ncbi:MAG: hypothetical protein JO311_04525, partial [Candidatus Eremiobacteraeota bacterium]|nr:hypothetical protein [Candidatus Eremiobacteraeota bacterium]